MSYDVASVRLWSSQTAQRIFNEVAAESSGQSTSSSSAGSLADMFFSESGEDTEDDSTLDLLIESLRRQAETGKSASEAEDEGDINDVSSTAFMKALRDKLENLRANPSTNVMATEMLKAVDAGTLTVTDAAAGTQIKAWDAYDAEPKPTSATTTTVSDWSSFLKERLQRDATAGYARNEDGSHKDKASGTSSYFGMIGENHYYLTWPSAKAASAATA